jgi:hypothetical protein
MKRGGRSYSSSWNLGCCEVTDLLSSGELPAGFAYPGEFLRIVDLGLLRLEPWWIIEGQVLRDRYAGLKARYPTRQLVPFAVRQDRDDVASFDADARNVAIIHDYADAGWEKRTEFRDFNSWLRHAFEELIAFGE